MHSLCFNASSAIFPRLVGVRGSRREHQIPKAGISNNRKRRKLVKKTEPRCIPSAASFTSQSNTMNMEMDSVSGLDDQSIVVLMRHGTTDWNMAGRVQGNLDESRLNEVGIKQATSAGKKLSGINFDAVYSSPLTRARHTYAIMASSSNNDSLRNVQPALLDGLTELQFPWQGLYRKSIKSSEFGKMFAEYQQHPRLFTFNGFSPLRDVERRAHTVWNHLRSRQSRCALVIAHNQINKALLSSALGIHANLKVWNQSNCCVNIFTLRKDRVPVLRLCNCAPSRLRYISNFHQLQQGTADGSLKDPLDDLSQQNSEPDDVNIVFRRAPRRTGFARAILYHVRGRENGDEAVHTHPRLPMEMAMAPVRTVYAVGGALELEVAKSLVAQGAAKNCHRVSRQWTRPNITTDGDYKYVYQTACYLLHKLRHNHSNESVGIMSGNGFLIAAFFAAAFNLGMYGINRVWSDAGGFSIIDVAHDRSRGAGTSSGSVLECFNTPLDIDDGAILPYTLPVPFNEL